MTKPLLCCCRLCRLFNGKAAEGELRGLAEATGGSHTQHDLIRHNLVVFKGGEGALQVGRAGLARRGAMHPASRHSGRTEVCMEHLQVVGVTCRPICLCL